MACLKRPLCPVCERRMPQSGVGHTCNTTIVEWIEGHQIVMYKSLPSFRAAIARDRRRINCAENSASPPHQS